MKASWTVLPSLFVLCIIASCSTEPASNPPTAPKLIETGPSVTLLTQTTSGGTLLYAKPGDALNGLTIVVPAGSYPASHTFSISYQPITKHSLPTGTDVLSPLITIDNGGGY